MARRLLNLLAIPSLLLCMAVLLMWVRSHFVYEQWGRMTPDHGAKIVRSAAGRLHFARHSWWDHTFGPTWERHGVQQPQDWPQYEYQRPATRRPASRARRRSPGACGAN